MKLQDKHWGSTTGIAIGILLFLIPFGSPELMGSHYFTTGILVILGSLAYRSRKKQTLPEIKKIPTLEIITTLLLFLHIALGLSNGLWYEHPVNFVAAPIWIIIAYASLLIIKNKK